MPGRKSSSTKKQKDQETFTVALKEYEKAMKSYQKKDWDKARDGFRQFLDEYAAMAAVSEIVDRARVHMSVCEQRLSPPLSDPESVEDWLARGVALANMGRVEQALEALDRAEQGGVTKSRVEYVRAAALAISERNDEALQHLARAIEADPENKAFSLGDPDFERLREMARYVSLVEPPNKKASAIDEVAAYERQGRAPQGERELLGD